MTTPTTSTCPNCRGVLQPGDPFCGSCGAVIASPTTPAPTQSLSTAPAAAGYPAEQSAWTVVGERLQAATIGEYEIFAELGRGGMAAVYLARDLALNRRVAIKVMSPSLLLGAGMVERFRREAVTVANLQHAHIVSIYGVQQRGDLHFFVMQFVPGRTLEGVLRDVGPLPVPVVRAWVYQVGSALGYAHRRGVIHRDVKPGNILLNADGEAVVTDFGIAKVAESPNQTQTGTVVGTPVYMSPEQCYARELTGASDQYSLGVVAYEMLAGRPPFSGSSFVLMRSHTDSPPPPLAEIRSDVPAELDAALMRMLAKTPEERFGSMADALVSLGAGALAPDDPLHANLRELAAATERMEQLADVVRTPASPVPQTRERPKAEPSAPQAATEATDDNPATIVPALTTAPPRRSRTVWWTVPAAIAVAVIGWAIARSSATPEPAASPPQPVVASAPAPVPPPRADSATPTTRDTVTPNAAPRVTGDSNARIPSVGADRAAAAPPPARTESSKRPVSPAPSSVPRKQPDAERTDSATRVESLLTVPKLSTPVDVAASRPGNTATPPAPKPAPVTLPKSEAELRTEVQGVLATYVRAIRDRDTSLIRRVFPAAGDDMLARWQATFDDARGPIEMTGGTVEILDTPRDVPGALVQARARYVARFASRVARSEQSFPVAFSAVLRRDGTTWHFIAIR